MLTELGVVISPSDLTQIVESVFSAMLGLEATGLGPPWFSGEDRLTAAVHLAGAWNGAVLIECDRAQACRFAGRYLSIDTPDSMDDVVRDVLGEIANMIGGNLKSALTRGIHISMPSVVDGSDYSMRVCGAEVSAQIGFQSAEGPFWVTALAMRPGLGVKRLTT